MGHTPSPRTFTAGAEGQGMVYKDHTAGVNVANHISSGAGPVSSKSTPGTPQGNAAVVSNLELSNDDLDLFPEDEDKGPSNGRHGV